MLSSFRTSNNVGTNKQQLIRKLMQPQTAGGQTGSGFSQGSGTGYGQSSDMHRSGEPAMHTGDATTGTAAPQV